MLPALSYHFNLKWADIVDMPPPELAEHIDFLIANGLTDTR